MTDSRNTEPDEPEPDKFELLMAEYLGQESALEGDELDLLLAAGEQEGDLEEGEFAALQHLAQTLDSVGAMEEIAQQPVSDDERSHAAEAWTELATGQSSGERDDVRRGIQPTQSLPTAWWKRPATVAFAAAAVLLAAFLGARSLALLGDGDPTEVVPGATLGTDPNTPNLAPFLTHGADSRWTVALDPLPESLRSAKRSLVLEAEISTANGLWSSLTTEAPTIGLEGVRWSWTDGASKVRGDARNLRFRIRLSVPAGRPSWTSDWFAGQDVLSP